MRFVFSKYIVICFFLFDFIRMFFGGFCFYFIDIDVVFLLGLLFCFGYRGWMV